MRQIIKTSFILLMFFVSMNLKGQNSNNDILLDSVKLAEYVYNNIHYPLIDLLNNVEGTAIYKFEFDSILKMNIFRTISSSGSNTLDLEGNRLLNQIVRGNEYPTQEILINFKLADNKIYEITEIFEDKPEFPGGNEEMFKFISKNVNWPREDREMNWTGHVICGFVIEKDGSINIVEVLRPLQHWFDAEAVRVIKKMPKWKVGKKDGKPVRVYFIVPVRFAVQ